MSRFRLGSILAVTAGILITTGGCAGTPTGIEADAASMARYETAPPPPPPAPEAGEEEVSTFSSGYIGTGTRQGIAEAP